MKIISTGMAAFFGLLIAAGPVKVWAAASPADAEALAMIKAVDLNEVQAAEEAAKKKVASNVENFAKLMNKEHGANMLKADALAQKIGVRPPMDSPGVKALQDQGGKDLAALTPLDGDQFASAYMEAMVKGHTDALNVIDTQLSKSVQDEEVKKFVTETRAHVSKHLDKAKEIQSSLTPAK